MKRVYLDSAATTPLLPEAAEAMAEFALREFGNASSLHAEGRRAKEAIDQSREVFSAKLGCLFGEVVFCSSGTEAANQAVIGTAMAALGGSRKRILMGAAEHHCVLHTRSVLEKLGFTVELVPVTSSAEVTAEAVRETMGDDVLLVCVMHANNETGVINDVAAISSVVRSLGALFYSDAVQTFPGDWTVDSLGADLVSVSAHKFYGPKGVGALYVRAGTEVAPLMVGGGQEREMRAGTENVVGLVGARVALVAYQDSWRVEARAARDAFEAALGDFGVRTVNPGVSRLGSHAHIRVPGVDAEVALIRLDRAGVSASSGAACSSGSLEPSHVLMACGCSEKEAREGLRFTFGRGVGVEDARWAAEVVRREVVGIQSRKYQ